MIFFKCCNKFIKTNKISSAFSKKLCQSLSKDVLTTPIRVLSSNSIKIDPISVQHSKLFKIERIASAFSLPLVPLSYFVHGGVIDYLLITAIVGHFHWGCISLISDYGRAVIIGEKMSVLVPKLVKILSIIMLATLFHFEYNDVGLTRAFELIFNI